MPTPIPADAAVVAFNDTLLLRGEDVGELTAMTFRLGSLYRKGNWVAGLGLLHASTMLGDLGKAREIAEDFWGKRASLGPDLQEVLAILYTSIGQYKRAVDLTFHRLDAHFPEKATRRHDVFTEAFFVHWDEAIAEAARGKDVGIGLIVGAVEAAGMLPHMAARQQAVNAILLPHQCGCMAGITSDGEDNIRLIRKVYVTGDYAERRALSDQVADAVSEWCAVWKLEEGQARAVLSEVILPVTARSMVDASALLEML